MSILKEIITFSQKPSSNIIEYDIETSGFVFYKQPALTQERINDGFNQPENVNGSYCAFYSQPLNKFGFIIYKSFIYQQSHPENIFWCDMLLDLENSILKITIPQDFYDNYMDEVCILDPTLGYTSFSSTSEFFISDFPYNSLSRIYATKIGTLPVNADVSSIQVYSKGIVVGGGYVNGTLKAALYLDNGSNYPGTRLEISATTHYITNTSYTVYTFPITQSLVSGQTLWVGFDTVSSNSNYQSRTYVKYTETPSVVNCKALITGNYTLTDPFPAGAISYEFYLHTWIEYTEVSGGTSKFPYLLFNQGVK